MFKAVLLLLSVASVNAAEIVEPKTAADGSLYGLKKETENCTIGNDCDVLLACQNISFTAGDSTVCIPQTECDGGSDAMIKKLDKTTNIGKRGPGNCLYRSFSQM